MMDSQERTNNILQLIENETNLVDRFTDIHRIDDNGGGGHFSLVFTAYDIENKENVALKFYDPQKLGDRDRYERFERECKMLCLLKDDPLVINIVGDGIEFFKKDLIDPTTGMTIPQEYPFFAMELADLNVADLIYNENDSSALTNLYIFREMVKAVLHLHRRGICHRDLKPDNFLIKDISKILISDFGTSKDMDSNYRNIREQYFQLNKLYKNLVEANLFKRLHKEESIFRQIDICIKTLENELSKQEKKQEKKRRKSVRQERLRLAYLRSKGTENVN